LNTEVREGRFREDLFYRINVVQVRIPPLRERRDDIPLLAREFLKEFCVRENKLLTVASQVMEVLRGYDWPGNVRQLRNIIERAVALSRDDILDLRDLPEELSHVSKGLQISVSRKTLKEVELLTIKDALEKCNGNKSKAAKILGISRKALYKRLNDEEKCFQ